MVYVFLDGGIAYKSECFSLLIELVGCWCWVESSYWAKHLALPVREGLLELFCNFCNVSGQDIDSTRGVVGQVLGLR